jgi:hypothetical protein
MTTPHEKNKRIGRTSLITAASIAGVVLAGSIAVGANIGILNAADDSDIGSLSAAGDLIPASTQVVDVYLDDPTTTTATSATTRPSMIGQEFAVDAAGTVAVVPTAGEVRLGDVVANAGWSWSLAQPDASALAVTFTDGVRTLEFTAALGADGTITAAVTEPIVSVSPSVPAGYEDDDGYEHDEYEDDDEHDDDEHEDSEHEGADDDD